MNSYISTFKKYAVFEGRARRKEYGIFLLFNLVIALVLGILDGILGTIFIGAVFNLAILLPTLAVGARRLHDMNWSAWWLLLFLIPIVGLIFLFVLTFKDGTAGENRFGPDPKGRGAIEVEAEAATA